MSVDHPFVFVGGLQRSGTTLVGRLLSQHPDATGLVGTPTREDEGQFIQDVYLDDHALGHKPGVAHGSVVRWAWNPSAHLTEQDAAATPDAASRLLASWGPYWERPAARWYVEKSPSNLTRTRFLQAVFPGSVFVIVTRHPILQALAVRKWTPRRQYVGLDFERLVEHWLDAMEIFAGDRDLLQRSVVWKYEDLVRAPAPFLTGAWDLLGVPEHPVDVSGVSDHSDRYLRYWQRWSADGGAGRPQPFESLYTKRGPSARMHAWAERGIADLTGARVARRLETRFGDRMAAWGYRLDDLAHRGPVTR